MATISATGTGRHGLSKSLSDFSRPCPSHLRFSSFSNPGPGTYTARSSFRKNNRDARSKQDCTWQTQRGGLEDGPKNNPGPGTYLKLEDAMKVADVLSQNRGTSMDAGYKFPLGPKDACAAAVNKNKNEGLGPGSHKLPSMDRRIMHENKTFGKPQPPSPLPDNKVPGPGTYDPVPLDTVPSFAIKKPTQDETRKRPNTVNVGPQHYNPRRP